MSNNKTIYVFSTIGQGDQFFEVFYNKDEVDWINNGGDNEQIVSKLKEREFKENNRGFDSDEDFYDHINKVKNLGSEWFCDRIVGAEHSFYSIELYTKYLLTLKDVNIIYFHGLIY
jgi:hypothetical protein